MTTSFRTPFKVLRRNLGQFINGVYQPDDNSGTEITVMASVQMPSSGDMQKIEATPYGQRAARFIKIYTDTRLTPVNQMIEGLRIRAPGDLFCYDGSQYLIFGESDFTMLKRTRATSVSHWRYFACELIEGYEMERIA